MPTPFVSILIAARNEADNIARCLAAIELLSYPKDKLEVLVGNDASTDDTAELIETFSSRLPYMHLYQIKHTIKGLKGKANVLAQLAKQAKGEWLFITDADVEVPESWIEGLLAAGHPAPMRMGITIPKGRSLFARMQGLDWLNTLQLLKMLSDAGRPVSTMGNNMVVSSRAYWAVGGYEAIPFSITEDYALFRAFRAVGLDFYHESSPEVLARTQPLPHVKAWLSQRLRWMQGAMQLPFGYRAAFFLQASWIPLLVVGIFVFPSLVAFLGVGKWLAQSLFLAYHNQRLGLDFRWWEIILYEVYLAVFTALLAAAYPFAKNIEWKGRRYSRDEG